MLIMWGMIGVCGYCALIVCCACAFSKDQEANPTQSNPSNQYQPLDPNQVYHDNQPQGMNNGYQMMQNPTYGNYKAEQRYA